MVWTNEIVMVIVTCGLGIALGSYYPPECPQHCECNTTREALCIDGVIPSLDHRITVFEIRDSAIPIPVLTTNITHNLQHLVTLQMDSVGMNEVEGGALAVIEHLNTLNITNNNITTLQTNIFTNCSELTNLDLRNNNIMVIENGTFEPLVGLKNLSLANNALTTLPKHLPLGLQLLDIEHNRVTILNLLPLTHLHTLNLCHNLITHADPTQVNFTTLENLCLGGEAFNLTASMGSIKSLSEVKQLTLKGTHSNLLQIPPDVQSAIQNFSKANLDTLQLDSCRIDHQGIKIFSSNLTNLKATDTEMTLGRIRSRKMKLPSIAILDFSGSPSLATNFISFGTPMPHLKVLKMSRCELKSFQESFVNFTIPNITKLDLSHNPLECTCYGMTWIPDYVREGKLNLLQEENTKCADPPHLKDKYLLSATMCPITETQTNSSTSNAPDLTSSSPHTPSTHTPTPNTPAYTSASNAPDLFTSLIPENLSSNNPDPPTSSISPRISIFNNTSSTSLGSSFNTTEITVIIGQRHQTVLVIGGVLGAIAVVAVIVGLVALFCRGIRRHRRRGFSGGVYNRTTSSDSDSVVFFEGVNDSCGGSSGGGGGGGDGGFGGMD